MNKTMTITRFLTLVALIPILVAPTIVSAAKPDSKNKPCKVTTALGSLLTPILENSANERSDLNEAVFSRMLEEFDHSGNSYIVPQTTGKQSDQFTPAITLRLRNGMATVVAIEPDSDGWRKNIKCGDIILKIGEKNCGGATLHEVNSLLKGEKDSLVKIKVLRKNNDKVYKVSLKREEVEGQLFVKTFVEKLLYIKPTKIDKTIGTKLEKALPENTDPLIGTILDLRGTIGGSPEEASTIAGFFTKDGIIARAITHGKDEVNYKIASHKVMKSRLVIIVDEGTGIAGEVLAAALQEKHRAVVMGKTTCGLGALYHTITNDIYGTVRLPKSLLVTPKGKTLFNKGLLPDIPAEYGKVGTREWGRFRHEILALLKDVKPDELEWPGKKKDEENDENSKIIDELTKTEGSEDEEDNGEVDEDEEDDTNGPSSKEHEASVEEKVLISYPLVRKFDRPFVRALNLLVSMNIFFSETGSGK